MADDSRLIFGSSVEALLTAARGTVSRDTELKLNALGISFGKKVEPAYPAEKWAQAVRVIAADLFPGELYEVQHRKLARRTVEQFAGTMLGKAMIPFVRLIGPERALQKLSNSLRTGANFLETRLTPIEEGVRELWISDVSDVPGFYAGLLEAGVTVMDGWPDVIHIKRREGPGCVYELRNSRR
jgi:uncharacterized protein (TIGR02265 family)